MTIYTSAEHGGALGSELSLAVRDLVTPSTPLLLKTAARLAFPDGSMTPLILRRKASRGELAIEKIGNRVYTTLADIERMRALCRQKPRALDSGSGEDERGQTGSASMATGASRTTETPEL